MLADKSTRRTLERGDFRLLHYAGEVTYCVVGKISLKPLHLPELNCLSESDLQKEVGPHLEPLCCGLFQDS